MSQFPVINAGTDMTAQVYNWMLPLIGLKTSDQSVTNSATYVADTQMLVPVEANATYAFDFFVIYEGGTQGSSDLKWELISITGATITYTATYINTSGGVVSGTDINPPIVAGTNGAGNSRVLRVTGVLVMGSTAGSFQAQWAQATANATPTIVHAGTWLQARRIA